MLVAMVGCGDAGVQPGNSTDGGAASPGGDGAAGSADDAAVTPEGASTIRLVSFGGTGGCLDLKDGLAADGAPLQVWQCFDDNENQRWTWDGATLESRDGRCLQVADGSDSVETWTCTGAANQVWQLTNDGTVTNAGLCLEVKDSDTSNGAAVRVAACGTPAPANQLWNVRAVGGASGTDAGLPAGTLSVLALGDSITNGYTCEYTTGGEAYPKLLGELLGAGYAVTNGGVPGDVVSQMADRYTATYHAQGFNRCFFMGGVNDIGRGASAADTFATASALLDQMRADGCQTTVLLVMPYHADPYGYDTPEHQQQRVLYNQSLQGYCDAKGIECLSTEAVLGDGATPPALRPEYSWDGIHPSAAGCVVLANLAKSAF